MIASTEVHIADHARMIEYGKSFAEFLVRGDVVLLHGDLGTGKTTFTQGLAVGLGIPDSIQSPTFALVAEHDGIDAKGDPLRLYHLDLYRLSDAAELEGIGFEDYIAPVDGISVIEWPDRAGGWLPERFWLLTFAYASDGGRLVERSWHDCDQLLADNQP